MQPSIRKRLTPWLSLASAWLWLVVFPLWQDGSYSRIPHAKWVGLLVLSGLTLLLSLPLLRRPRLRPSLAFAAGFAGWMLLAACFGAYHHTVYQGRASVWFGTLRYEGMLTKLIYLLLFLLMRLHRPKPAPLMMGVSPSPRCNTRGSTRWGCSRPGGQSLRITNFNPRSATSTWFPAC